MEGEGEGEANPRQNKRLLVKGHSNKTKLLKNKNEQTNKQTPNTPPKKSLLRFSIYAGENVLFVSFGASTQMIQLMNESVATMKQ